MGPAEATEGKAGPGPNLPRALVGKGGASKVPAFNRYSVPRAAQCSGPEANELVLLHKPPYYGTVSGPGTKACYDFRAWVPVTWGTGTLRDVRKRVNQPSPGPADSEIKGENMRAVGSIGTH